MRYQEVLLKDASNLGKDLRQKLYQNNDDELNNPVKAGLPTFYLLSKNYLYLKEVANRNNIDITSDELAKLAGLAYNQSIGKIAGELVDKGSYQNYYNYRVKTATDPGGQFKYRKVMDLYDRQTMRDGGIVPGRYKNPEGNWVSKYANGGDISIPDLSKKGWLDKYQNGAAKDKNFRRSVDADYTQRIQKMLNQTYGTGLSEDGVWGPLTEKAYQNHLQINNLQNQINKLDAKQQAFKNQDAALKKVNTTAKKSSTSVVVPKVENAKKQVESVQREAARVKNKMQETGAKSEAEVYASEAAEAAKAKLMQQPVLKPAEDKTAGDYLSHAWDIASNPITAFGYKARGEEIPWGFTHGERNPLEYGTDVINPAFYLNAAGRVADAVTTGSTYTKTLPQAIGATAGLLMNEEVPEEWNDEAVKTLGIIGDATVVSQGLKAVSEVGTAIRNAKSSNFINVKQEHVFPGMSNPKVARNLSLKYKTPLPDLHFKDSKEFLNWYKKTQNNRPLTNKEINFLNKELKERGILEVQRSHPLNPLPNLTRRMLIPEDYNWEKVLNEAGPNLLKSFKGMDNLYKDYVMGPGRLNAFNQWLGLPTKGTMYRVHPGSFQDGQGLLYTTTGNSMKGIFDPELKRLVPKSQHTRPVGKDTFNELDVAVKAANKEPYQKQLQDMGYTDLEDFTDETGIIVSRRPNTVLDYDKYTGSAGGASWVRVPKRGGGYEWTMRDTWDIQPFSRMTTMPKFIRDIDVANLVGAKNFDVNWTYHTSPKFNSVSNVYYPGRGWSVKKDGGWLNRYQDGNQVVDQQNQKYQDAMKWHEGWMNSPMYNEMLYTGDNRGESQEELAQKDLRRKNNLQNLRNTPLFIDYEEENPFTAGYYDPNFKQVGITPKGFDDPTTITHEIRHGVDDEYDFDFTKKKIGFNMPEEDLRYLEKNQPGSYRRTKKQLREFDQYSPFYNEDWRDKDSWENNKDYFTNPSEVNARLSEIRRLSQEQGAYDPFTQKVPNDFFNKVSIDALEELQRYYSNDQIKHMLNTFSYNDTQNNPTGIYQSKLGGPSKWLDKYQKKGEVTPRANLPWINQQGQFTQVPPTEPKNFESRVDDFLGNPMQKARDLASWASGPDNDPVDNLRHSAAAANMAHSTKEKTGSALAGFTAANMLGAAHELYALPSAIKSDGWYHGLMSTAEDLFNNAVGAVAGVLPYIPIEAKESLLVHLTDNNMLPDGVSLPQGDMYWKKKKGGVKSSAEGYYDYINGYSGIFAKAGGSPTKSNWLNKYK